MNEAILRNMTFDEKVRHGLVPPDLIADINDLYIKLKYAEETPAEDYSWEVDELEDKISDLENDQDELVLMIERIRDNPEVTMPEKLREDIVRLLKRYP